MCFKPSPDTLLAEIRVARKPVASHHLYMSSDQTKIHNIDKDFSSYKG